MVRRLLALAVGAVRRLLQDLGSARGRSVMTSVLLAAAAPPFGVL